MEYETAGDPVTGLKWTRKTTRKIADELNSAGINISKDTVGSLLKDMNFSLKVNHKKTSGGGRKLSVKEKRDRDNQFNYINKLRKSFTDKGFGVISGDAKKKEQIGNFKNSGTAWKDKEECVNDHDFASYAVGKAVLYSIYDTITNRGTVFVGTTHDTPAFAVDCIEKWFRTEGRLSYPGKPEILILVDCGGSNSARSRVWKYDIQNKLCDRYGLTVTVCHYPPGASKWNPADHRLHSEISKNWAGEPLRSYEKVLKFIRTTKTETGLKVSSHYVRKHYETGRKISDKDFESISVSRHKIFPDWNYTIYPR